MERRGLLAVLGGALAALPALRSAAAAEAEKSGHRVAIQVSANDAATMTLALNNARSVVDYYARKGAKAAVEIVAYGPGLHMLREDTSPVIGRIAAFKESMPSVQFSACNNTLKGMEKAEGKPIKLIPEAVVVPAGIVRLMERQEEGWSYIRP